MKNTKKTKKDSKRKGSIFSDAIGNKVCAMIARGMSLREIANEKGMPKPSTVSMWVVENAEFAEQYARARQAQAHILADEIIEIADDNSRDVVEGKRGEEVNYDHIQRSRLRVDTRKWYLSKVLPKIYGDKIEVGGDMTLRIPTITFHSTNSNPIKKESDLDG